MIVRKAGKAFAQQCKTIILTKRGSFRLNIACYLDGKSYVSKTIDNPKDRDWKRKRKRV